MTIREATHADLDDLVIMGRRFRAESGYATVIADNPAQMRATASALIDSDRGAVYVADYGGMLVGMIGFVLIENHISGELTAGEVFWWTAEPGVTGLRLFARAKQWAQLTGATKLQMIQPCANARVGELYKHLGLLAIETTWQMNLEAA